MMDTIENEEPAFPFLKPHLMVPAELQVKVRKLEEIIKELEQDIVLYKNVAKDLAFPLIGNDAEEFVEACFKNAKKEKTG